MSGVRAVLAGRLPLVGYRGGTEHSAPSPAAAIMPGAFAPLHRGHREMARVAERILGRAVEFELAIYNVDKGPLDQAEVFRRLGQFAGSQLVWVTRAPTFVQKAEMFPAATFVVGSDTLSRVASPQYYSPDLPLEPAIARLCQLSVRFLVFGRKIGGDFRSFDSLDLPPRLAAICRGVSESDFRHDISSTELRTRGEFAQRGNCGDE